MSPTAAVHFQPQVAEGMQRGFDQMINAIRPTLGPTPRLVANAPTILNQPPELLDNGGVIARRIVQLEDRMEDVGAMFLRQALWRVHELVGDGTATTAVLFDALYRYGRRYIAAGGNAQLLRRHLEDSAQQVIAALENQVHKVEGRRQIAQAAQSLCYDAELAEALGEIFDIIGAEGWFEIREGRGREVRREYVPGAFWESQLLAKTQANQTGRSRAEAYNPGLVISDLEIEDPRDLIPVFDRLKEKGLGALVLVARSVSEQATAFLHAAETRGGIQIVTAKVPGLNITTQAQAMEDLAVLTGGHPILSATGESLRSLRVDDLGQARRVWADDAFLGLFGGKGAPAQRRQQLERLRRAWELTPEVAQRREIEARIGRMLGGSAYLWIGAATESELKIRRELADRTARTLRSVLRRGMVPGGGRALLDCRVALSQEPAYQLDPDRRAALNALNTALEAPLRAIAANAGRDPSQVLAHLEQAGGDHTYDALHDRVLPVEQAGLWDSVEVLITAVETAVHSAALALSTDVIIQRRRRRLSINP